MTEPKEKIAERMANEFYNMENNMDYYVDVSIGKDNLGNLVRLVRESEFLRLKEYLEDIANEPEGTGFDLKGHAQEALDFIGEDNTTTPPQTNVVELE